MLEWPNCRLIVSVLYLKWVFKIKKVNYIQINAIYCTSGPTLLKIVAYWIFSVKLEPNVNNWNNVKLYFHVFIDTTWQEYIM